MEKKQKLNEWEQEQTNESREICEDEGQKQIKQGKKQKGKGKRQIKKGMKHNERRQSVRSHSIDKGEPAPLSIDIVIYWVIKNPY